MHRRADLRGREGAENGCPTPPRVFEGYSLPLFPSCKAKITLQGKNNLENVHCVLVLKGYFQRASKNNLAK